jgi:hypothetical protein
VVTPCAALGEGSDLIVMPPEKRQKISGEFLSPCSAGGPWSWRARRQSASYTPRSRLINRGGLISSAPASYSRRATRKSPGQRVSRAIGCVSVVYSLPISRPQPTAETSKSSCCCSQRILIHQNMLVLEGEAGG